MANPLPDTKPFAGFEWLLALRYLRARRKEGFISAISLISFLGITIGVAALIVVMAVFNGFRAELLDKILGFSGHASMMRPDLSPIPDYRELKTRLEAISGVSYVITLVEGQVLASSQLNSTGALVRGISEEDIKKLPSLQNKDLKTEFRDPPNPDTVASFDGFDKSQGALVGAGFAQRHQLQLGSTITLISPEGPETAIGSVPTSQTYPVVGIFKAGMSDYDNSIVYLPFKTAQEFLMSEDGASGLEVMIDHPDKIADLVPALRVAGGELLTLQTWQERNSAFFSALNVERNVVSLVVGMVVLVAALNIISGLIMLVKDKGRDIAILRTMGATRGAIQRIFLITGAMIGVTGTLAGFILGATICWNVEHIRKFIEWSSGVDPFNPELYYLAQLPARMDMNQTLLIVITSLLLSLLATLYPSYKAAKLDPVEALRYE